jgi:hypothetical protein
MSPAKAEAARSTRSQHALVALLYLALVLWAYRSILPSPGTLLPMPASMVGNKTATLYQGDQRFVVGALARTAHQLLTDPAGLAGFGLCYPLRASYTLGEHMFGEALLALPAYAASGDPIVSYNAMVLLSLWVAALAMYALALHWTGSVAAALVAGLLFAFHPAKVANPAHPFVHGNLWTPLALLLAHRLFLTRRWRDALGLALFVSLQLLESFYQVLALAVLGGVHGLWLVMRYPRAVASLLPKLLAVAAATGVVAWLVFGPYLETRAVWGVLQGRERTLLFFPADYLPGRGASVGVVALLLAAVGLADRVRGPRPTNGVDPRLAMLVAGLLVLWCTLHPLALPVLGLRIESPLVALAAWVPGLNAVRVLRALRFGVYLVAAFLAGYGVLALIERLRPPARRAATAVAAACALYETFAPTSLPPPGRRPVALAAYRALPASDVIELARQAPEGAVLDLPLTFDAAGKLLDMPQYVLLAAYHHRPAAACYNSFRTPLQFEVAELAARLPDPAASDALHALGVRSLLVHRDRIQPRKMRQLLRLLADGQRTREIGDVDGTLLYELLSPRATSDALELLAAPGQQPGAGDVPRAPLALARPSATLPVELTNHGAESFRHPTLEPSLLDVRWREGGGRVAATSRTRALLPTALAPGATAQRDVEVEVPDALGDGAYTVEVTLAGRPELVLARREVVLGQAGSVGAASGSSSAASSSTLGLVSP